MPELPEVETTRQGVAPFIEGLRVHGVTIRDPRLRWPVPSDLPARVTGKRVLTVARRGKYLLVNFSDGALIIHLGMSGSLRVITDQSAPLTHDHVELEMETGTRLRFNDPRRFGCCLWSEAPLTHALIASLGPEPLSEACTGPYLHARARHRKAPVKNFIMDSHVVVGVGNIYANEALFKAGIDPRRAAGRISRARYARLAETIRETLSAAILMGGTTLRDFINSDGQPGYFAQSLLAYGRGGMPCGNCGETLTEIRISQRSTVFCRHCQR